jgi:ubiquinol-cytochrome c reductase cytochrome c1 subunit
MRRIILAAIAAALFFTGTARASETPARPNQKWSFEGVFGTYDRTALRRGLQVYTEVCSACHTLNLLAYRHLVQAGFTEAEVKSIAAKVEVTDGPNDQGEMFTRAGKPTDTFKAPFPNKMAAAAANGGALPPDLSLIIKARKNGADYLHALMMGYTTPPTGMKILDGMNYNAYFSGYQIQMPKPLNDGQITYPDKTKATVDQMARDLVTFLAWASEPRMEDRKRMGIKVLLFLLILTGMLYALKRKIWSDAH